jgi:hypothetical protein
MDTVLTDHILTEFLKRLRSRAEIGDFEVRPWKDMTDRGLTVYELSGSLSLLLHVQAAVGTDPVWRLSHQLMCDLKASGQKWAMILLHRTTEKGYLVPSGEVYLRADSGQWSLHDGTYELAPGVSLRAAHRFASSDELVFRLLTAAPV